MPPVVGVADNGDFGKIMGPAGLAYRTDSYAERYWNWSHVKFAIVRPDPFPGWYKSSETLLTIAAVDLSRVLRPGKDFDIRILGLLHALLLLAFLGLIAEATGELPVGLQAVTLAAAAFFYTDVGYVAVFNSLYSQAASLLFLLLTVGAAGLSIRRGRLEGGLLVGYFLAAALFVCSKPQEFVHGPLLALLGAVLAGASWRDGMRPAATRLAVALCAAAAVYYAAIPRREIREIGLYHTVFVELLPSSPDPGRDLEALGLDRDLLRYSGVNAYEPAAPLRNPDFRSRFFERFGYARVLGFYLARPARLWDRLERAGRAAFTLRPGTTGNFSRESGLPAQTRATRFSAWSSLRARLGGRGGILWVAAVILGSYANAWTLRSRRARGRAIGWALAVFATIAAVQFFVCAFADYLGDVSRHLYAFQGLWDALLLANLVAVAARIATPARRSAAHNGRTTRANAV